MVCQLPEKLVPDLATIMNNNGRNDKCIKYKELEGD
jgi:hypothetical protein